MVRVRSILIAVFRAVVIEPLTTGTSITGEDPRHTDGSVASVVTVSGLAAVSFVIIGICTQFPKSHHDILWILAGIMLILALISMIVISIVANKHRQEWLLDMPLSYKTKVQKLKIVFLWIFGLAIILQRTLRLLINIDCITKDTSDKIFRRVENIGNNLLAIISYCVQMGFISYFSYYRFQGLLCVNYAVLLILLSNLFYWFEAVMNEASHDYGIPQKIYNTTDCYYASPIQTFMHTLMPYIVPARIEFFLLATTFVLNMWPPMQSTPNTIDIDDHSAHHSQGSFAINAEDSERTPLVSRPPPQQQSGGGSAESISLQMHGNNRLVHVPPVSYFLTMFIMLVMNMPVVISNIVLAFVFKGNDNAFFATTTVDCVYKCLTLAISTLLICRISKETECETPARKLSANEYVLILSAAASAGGCAFAIISGIQTYTLVGHVFLAKNVAGIFSIYAQTTIIIYSVRTRRKAHSEESSFWALNHMFVLLSVCNLILWILDTFIKVPFTTYDQVQLGIFGHKTWRSLKNVLSPLQIFYRFHASIDFYGLYCKFK